MADTVSIQILNNGPRNLIIKLTGQSDGTGESAVVKVDASAYGANRLSILEIQYDIGGQGVELLWDAAPAKTIILLPEGQNSNDYRKIGGLVNDAGSTATGDILLTTLSPVSGDNYTIVLHLKKKQ